MPFELKEGFYGLVRGKQILAREEILCFGRHFFLEGLRYKLCNLVLSPHSLFFLRLLLFSLTLCCLGWILEATGLFVRDNLAFMFVIIDFNLLCSCCGSEMLKNHAYI